MHLMYVDESGDDGFKLDLPPDTPGSSKVFIRTGLIVHDWCWRRVNSEIKRFRTIHDIRICQSPQGPELGIPDRTVQSVSSQAERSDRNYHIGCG